MQQQSVFMNQWSISSNYLIAILLIQCLSPSVVWSQLDFQSETIDSKVAIGYGIAIGDVDGDGDKDILLADKKEFVWYENPNWERHVMVENLTARDNVCIAARDIDGEVGVGSKGLFANNGIIDEVLADSVSVLQGSSHGGQVATDITGGNVTRDDLHLDDVGIDRSITVV